MLNMLKKLLVCTTITTTFFATNAYAENKMIVSYNVNFRSTPSTVGEIIKLIHSGTIVDVKDNVDDWSKVNIDGIEGYIRSDLLSYHDIQDVENIQVNIDNVELLDWSIAKDVFEIGKDAQVYDIYTGKIYYVRSFSNGFHADVEPITVEDTQIMKETFGGVWSWSVRPVLVTVGNRTMAASINGMPHGGGVNSDNGMDGQVCIHFLGSRTHNGNTSFSQLHQDYVMKAFNYFN